MRYNEVQCISLLPLGSLIISSLCRLSNLSSFQRFWLTKADYQEKGPVLLHDNSKLFEDIKNSNSELSKATV